MTLDPNMNLHSNVQAFIFDDFPLYAKSIADHYGFIFMVGLERETFGKGFYEGKAPKMIMSRSHDYHDITINITFAFDGCDEPFQLKAAISAFTLKISEKTYEPNIVTNTLLYYRNGSQETTQDKTISWVNKDDVFGMIENLIRYSLPSGMSEDFKTLFKFSADETQPSTPVDPNP